MNIRDIDAYSTTLTGAQPGWRGRPPLLFFENRKKCPDFGKKALIVSIFSNLYSDLKLCTGSDTFRILAYKEL